MGLVRIGQVDLATGELMEGSVVLVAPRRLNGFREGWVAMGQEAMWLLAQQNLGGVTFRVLMALLARLDYENFLRVEKPALAQEIGVSRPGIYRAFDRLVAEGIVLEGPVYPGRVHTDTYSLNPSYGWKGSARNHQKALGARKRTQGLSVVAMGAASALETGQSPSG
jgi:hypothetical protein